MHSSPSSVSIIFINASLDDHNHSYIHQACGTLHCLIRTLRAIASARETHLKADGERWKLGTGRLKVECLEDGTKYMIASKKERLLQMSM